MAVIFPDNFNYIGREPNFVRDSVNTIADLLAIDPTKNKYDYGHIVFCKEDGNHYRFNYNYDNPPANDEKDAVTGWFVPSDGTRKAVRNSEGSVLSKGYIILNRNRNFVSQINVDETIYEIRDYFDLNGETITLPKNCVLKFEGGMLANGTVIGNGITIEAPLFRIFADDITLKGDFNCDFYPEWFGAVTYSEDTAIDNAAVFNNAITQIYNMSGAHDLILTGVYLIRDTIFLKPKASLIGRYGKTIYDASLGDKKIGSGFLVDFNDNNKYAIDSYLTQLFHKVDSNGNLVLDEKGKPIPTVSGTRQAVINYNRLWFDSSPTDENLSSYTLIGEGSEEITNATRSLHTNGWRKSINIKNIILQPLNKPTQSSEIPFGGIRLISWFSGTIDSVTIQGFAVCLNIAESWSCYINRLNIKTYYIGVYFGKFCTQCDIRNSDIERVGNDVVFNHKDAALVYRSKSGLLLPYDEKGRVEGDEGFTYSITKYIAEAKTVADDFITNHKSTQLLTVAIMTESYDYDYTKLLLDNIVFQFIDAIFINTNNCNVSFNFCYIESVFKLGLYTNWGKIKWLNPSFEGTPINPYGAVTKTGQIKVEGVPHIRCYPHYTYDEFKNRQIGAKDAKYVISDGGLFYDKFTITPAADNTEFNHTIPLKGTVEPGSVAAAKEIIPIDNTYHVGYWPFSRYYAYSYPELASGLSSSSITSFPNIISRHNPDIATFCTYGYGTDFSGADTNGSVPLLRNKKFTIIQITDKDNSTNNATNIFPLRHTMRLFNSDITIKGFEFYKTMRNEVDGKSPVTLDYLFEVSGKCRIVATNGYSEPTKFIKLAAGPNNEPVELEFIGNKNWNKYDELIDNPDNVKYKIKIYSKLYPNGSTFTNTTPPTKGVAKGETFIYNGITLVWNGSSWDTQLIPNYNLYVALGAEYNNTGADVIKTAPWGEVTHKNGCWYYNGIGDLSTNDMSQIYLHKDILTTGASTRYGTARLDSLRTIAPIGFAQSISQMSIDSVRFFFRCQKLQVLRWGLKGPGFYDDTEVAFDTTNVNAMPKMGTSMESAFSESFKLQYIYPINVSNTTNMTNAFLMGINCALRDVRLYGLKVSVDFKECPYLKKECLMYIISNANPTTAITITLHATAYANLAEDTEIVAKLEEKNTSLSAGGGSIGLEPA